jgi:hypothetical protein
MKALKAIFDFYINSSIHVALAVFALSWLTLLEFGLPYDHDLLYFIFFASIIGYNFVKYFGLVKFHYRSLARWLKVIQVFSFLCFLPLLYFAAFLEVATLLFISIFAGITFLYAIPLLPKNLFLDQKQKLRSISGVKIYIIALVWSGVTVFLPLLNAGYHLNSDELLMALQRFVFVLALMMPFEIRDLSYDSIKLATMPQIIGVVNTKLMGLVLLLIFVLIEFFIKTARVQQFEILFVIALLSAAFIIGSKKNQHRYYSGFFVEAIPIVWLVLRLFMD